MRGLRNAACEYADRGWHVVPINPHGSTSAKLAKAPLGRLVPNGLSQATDDLATVFRWWRAEPRANVGIVAKPSGLLILDVDPRDGGDESLHELERALGPLPETVRAETGGGGEHYLCQHPGGDLRGKAAPGVDVRDTAYVLAPPSIHPSGRPYAWDLAPGEVELAELPDAWVEHLRPAFAKRTDDPSIRSDHPDPLRRIPSRAYVPKMTRRRANRSGFFQCPFHKGGQERTPSLLAEGTVWACYGCEPVGDRRVMGGDIYDLAAFLAGYAVPLRGPDFRDVQARLDRLFEVTR